MAGKTKIDWEAMEPDWRAGIKSKKQLSEEHGVSRAAIDKHWGKAGIERDLSAKIRAEAKSRVARATVTPTVTPETRVTEQEVVEANATLQAGVQLSQRKDIARFRALVVALLGELEQQIADPDLFEQLGVAISEGDAAGLTDAYKKVLSLPSQVDTIKKLAEALRILVQLERQAYNLDESGGAGDDPLSQILKAVAARNKPLVTDE